MSNSPPPQADQDVKPDKAAGKITLKVQCKPSHLSLSQILPTSETHETVISLFFLSMQLNSPDQPFIDPQSYPQTSITHSCQYLMISHFASE
ncbi:hypothetical protein Pst134EA_011661 [Puccinia striiformis f. sp. tritici]|uniref:hypothetical protein n=1 Tax=Puccinia striiformis f. sp. tritici TaxID=168172 RepID=UPI002008E3EC|nr:hypothetical protein Pst134EA_011661 [Puccinia striiformis f. sp. tritici]KAH9468042.1 hypothetical protein Pst134EA_011661 [Puccinia striiformis f. sp. tritici]